MKAAEVEDEIRSLEVGVQQDYLDQVAGAVRSVTVSELERAIESGSESRIEEIIALGLFSALTIRLRSIFVRGATQELPSIKIPSIRREIDFNDPSVASFLAGQAATIRQQAAIEQIQAVREAITAGAIRGDSRRAVTLNILGRVSRQTGIRTGGYIGMSRAGARAVEAARDQLMSGDPGQLRAYLERGRRDRAFDPIVKLSISTGKAIPKEVVAAAAKSYSERILAAHAETIAQTNAAEAYNKGRDEGWRQMTARSNGLYTFAKKWVSRRDQLVRGTHQALNGKTVERDEPFRSPSGALLMFPGDTSLGAPMYELARCRCVAEYFLRKNEQVRP